MGIDITSYQYPTSTEYTDESKDAEAHQEPASEAYRSSVQDDAHPLFSPEGLKKTINLNRSLSNSVKEFITGDIDPKLIKDTMLASIKSKVPYELLAFAMDFEKKLDDRGGSSNASEVAQKMKSFIPELTSSLGRQPLSSELLMAYALGSGSKVKDLLDKAKEKPNEEAEKAGTQYDDVIFQKPKYEKIKPRTNKEVVQFFQNRMGLGNRVFPHTV